MKKFKECIEKFCRELQIYKSKCIPTNEDGYLEINVIFDNNGREDETQFDIKPCNLDYITGKCSELETLWKDFCKEEHIAMSSVEKIYMTV